MTGHLGYSGIGGRDSDDYFYIISPRDGNVVLSATYDEGLYGRIYLYNKNGSLIGYSAWLDGESGSYTAYCQAADTLIARFHGYSGCGSYTASFTTPELDNANDVEPNETIATIKQTFEEGVEWTGHLGHYTVGIGTDSYDYFYIISPRDGNVTFSATFDESLNGDIVLFNKNGNRLGTTNLNAANGHSDSITAYCQIADTLVARTYRSSGCGSSTASFTTSEMVTASDVEPNGTIATIKEIFEEGVEWTGHLGYSGAGFPRDDYDYFYIISPRDGDVTFSATFDESLNGDIVLFNKNGNRYTTVQMNAANGHSGSTTAYCQAADTLVARTYRSSGCGSYTASFSTTTLGFEDDVEPNNTIATATPSLNSSVNEGHLGHYSIASGTDLYDFYQISVAEVPFELEAKLVTSDGFNGILTLYGGSANYLSQVFFNGDTETSLTRTITVAGNYYVRVHASSGCGSYSLGNFCANAPEVAITPGGPTDICPGESVLLTATAGLNAYSWLRNGIEVSTTQIYLATEPGTYIVSGYDANGCDGLSEEVVIGVFNVPAVSISTDDPTSFCVGSATITATVGFDSYLWSNGEIGQSIEVSKSGTYSVTATTEDGCEKVSSNSIEITLLPDSDGDGICDDDDSCPFFFGEVGDTCDDGNDMTENDVITEDCECVGTPIPAVLNGSVTWNSACGERDATVKLYEPGTATQVASYDVSIQSDGSFNIPELEIGTFDVIVKVDGYLAKGIQSVEITAGDNSISVGSIINGNMNNDGAVNITDFSLFAPAFSSVVEDVNYNPLADLNCNGAVNITDFSIFVTGFSKVGDTAPLPPLVAQ